ncbi:TonB family protein [Desulfocapsa sulfexigens DSM 10523]|uniref:TonB family protein n=1 Tax=Desulfocapsa sulfexigens (strain DSM 10523 / SB164P1) TaxID=1167006 RepID=M1PIW7_DESSD|nr:energy transducer TonB [Desulfocapsa sulfexigens]AGF79510.1 TonB family protein [Desulfocapsa sulfexigens DSM 10523]
MTSSANSWKLPFNLAVLSHVLILASAIILPKYFHKKPLIQEFLSVDLVNIAAPLPSTPQPTPAPPQIKQEVKPSSSPPPAERKKTAPIVPIRPTVTKEVIPSPVEAISIQPLKRKVKVKIPKNTASETNRQRDRERERRQLLEEARRQKALADAEAAAANDAVKALKQLLQADSVTSATQTATQPTTTRSGGNSNTAIENQYIATIGSSLNQHWALPEIKPWNPDLSATVIIHIAKDGKIINHRFEKRSGDSVYDQFVSRTIQDANPLPPIPGAMKVSDFTIGLRFTPGQIR